MKIIVRGNQAFTLVEVIMAFCMAGIMSGAFLFGYTVSVRRSEWTSCSLAAQAMAMRRMEQVVDATWIPAYGVDQLVNSNFPPQADYLALPTQQTNLVNVTNFTTITTVSTTPPLRMIRVDCVWNFFGFWISSNKSGVFSNTVITLRAPNL